MDIKSKELVALGASVSAHCFPCFDAHLEKARKLEICEEDIQEAVRVGFMVMNGAGEKMWIKIKEILTEVSLGEHESCTNKSEKVKAFYNPQVRF